MESGVKKAKGVDQKGPTSVWEVSRSRRPVHPAHCRGGYLLRPRREIEEDIVLRNHYYKKAEFEGGSIG